MACSHAALLIELISSLNRDGELIVLFPARATLSIKTSGNLVLSATPS